MYSVNQDIHIWVYMINISGPASDCIILFAQVPVMSVLLQHKPLRCLNLRKMGQLWSIVGSELLNDNGYAAAFDQWRKRRSADIKHVLPSDECPAVSAAALNKGSNRWRYIAVTDRIGSSSWGLMIIIVHVLQVFCCLTPCWFLLIRDSAEAALVVGNPLPDEYSSLFSFRVLQVAKLGFS